MIRDIQISTLVKYIYFLLIALIYFIFISIDLLSKNTSNFYSITLKYSSIVIFFITSLLIGKKGYNLNDTRLLQGALFFTLCADTCMLILKYFKLGVFFFCIVQILYITRHVLLFNIRKSKFSISLILLIIFPLILYIIRPEKIDPQLFNIAIIYAILLITSLLVALKSKRLIAYGMILFFLCDINVGLSNILGIYPIYIGNVSLQFITSFYVWIFYLPSQLFLTLSGFREFTM